MYFKQFSWRPKLNDFSVESIGEVEANWLERVFEEVEVFEVVKAMIVIRPRLLIVKTGCCGIFPSLLTCDIRGYYEGLP
jgi:hypothetical protein